MTIAETKRAMTAKARKKTARKSVPPVNSVTLSSACWVAVTTVTSTPFASRAERMAAEVVASSVEATTAISSHPCVPVSSVTPAGVAKTAGVPPAYRGSPATSMIPTTVARTGVADVVAIAVTGTVSPTSSWLPEATVLDRAISVGARGARPSITGCGATADSVVIIA